MNLKQLEYFVQVAELGSFSKAAVVLDIAQPALSRQVRGLEIELHETLLLRNGRGVTLTEAGQRLFEHSVGILQQVALALEDLGERRDAPVGRITIALPPSMSRQLTLPLVEGFRHQLPQARLAIVEGLSTHIAEWITTGHVDMGLMYNPEAQPSLAIRPVLEERLCLVEPARGAPPGLGANADGGATLALRELSRYALIVPERQHVIRRLLDAQATLAGLQLDIAWEVSSVPAIIDLVCAGHGHAVLTASAVAASGRAGELAVRTLVDPSLVSVLCLAIAAHRRPTPLMRNAAAMLTELVGQLPQAAPRAPAG